MSNSMSNVNSSDSSVWIENLVNGLAGISIKAKHAVFCESSPFQKVEVFDTYAYGRILILAGTIVLTEKDEFIYNEMITHPAMIMHPNPTKVCIIGGGDGGALREVLKHPTVKAVTVVEIDELVIRTVKAHFPAMASGLTDPRARVVIDDGYGFLDKGDDSFDVIIVDSFDPGGPVQSLSTENFYHLVHDHLDPDGIAVFQTDSPTVRKETLKQTIRSVSALFPHYKPYVASIPSFPEGICSFVAASRTEKGLAKFDSKRYPGVAKQCYCYNKAVHTGAFLLPEHITAALN
jgi:spermidine synthase